MKEIYNLINQNYNLGELIRASSNELGTGESYIVQFETGNYIVKFFNQNGFDNPLLEIRSM